MSTIEFFFYLFVYSFIVTYFVLGFIIGFEAMLALYGVQSAVQWIREWHKPSTFKTMLIIFLPMLQLAYIFLEWIPYMVGFNKHIRPFDLDQIYLTVFPKEEV